MNSSAADDPNGPFGISKADMDSFLEMAIAFKKIRDKRLYRNSYASFDDYCRSKYGMSGSEVDRYIAEADLEIITRKGNRAAQ